MRHILDRRTSIPKVLSVLRAATVPRSTEILPMGFDSITLAYIQRWAGTGFDQLRVFYQPAGPPLRISGFGTLADLLNLRLRLGLKVGR